MLDTTTRDRTAEVLAAMLHENTGTHLLDSGGRPKYDEHGQYMGSEYGYGRHWERNLGRRFEDEPATLVSFRWGIEVTHHVYHWLVERLEFDEAIQDLFDAFQEQA
ncbi:MAG: hypothetical protein AB1716_10560, partial [Planctomycetota bacterium]